LLRENGTAHPPSGRGLSAAIGPITGVHRIDHRGRHDGPADRFQRI